MVECYYYIILCYYCYYYISTVSFFFFSRLELKQEMRESTESTTSLIRVENA